MNDNYFESSSNLDINKMYILIFTLLLTLLSPMSLASTSNQFQISNHKYRILAIDGGGIRGIIPARILQEIEQKTGRPIHEIFDLIVGTSTGGLVAIMLTAPGKDGAALYKAEDLVYFYKNKGKEIFSSSLFRNIATGFSLWGAKYNRSKLDNILQQMLGKTLLSQTLRPIMVLSYSLNLGQTHLWITSDAKGSVEHDFYLKDIAGATSAAPTYFKPKTLRNKLGSESYLECDGGIYANNPTIMAIAEARKINPSLDKEDILIISIGTGKIKLNKDPNILKDSGIIGWIMQADLIGAMMSSSSEIINWQSSILNLNTTRLQIDINDKSLGKMDDASKKNIDGLLKITEDYIKTNSVVIDNLCKTLAKPINKRD